jgi:hypothetical protein
MATVKLLSFYSSASAGANSLAQIATQDDNQDRTIVGILCNDQTKLVRTQVQLAGKLVFDVDDGLMAQQKEWIDCNIVFKAGVFIFLGLQNGSGGNITNAGITVKYSVPV